MSAELGFHLTREGGHSHRRIVHAADATGHAVVTHARRTRAQSSEHHRARRSQRDRPDHVRPPRLARASLPRPVRARSRKRPHGDDRSAAYGARHRRRRQGLPLHDESRHRDRRRRRDGVPRGRRVANMEFIQFHPTCLFHPHAEIFLITRGAARRRRHPAAARRHALHAALTTSAPSSRRATSSRARSTPRSRSAASTASSSTSRHQPPAFLDEHFPTIHATLPRVRHRHHASSRSRSCRRRTITCGGVVTDLARAHAIAPACTRSARRRCTGLHGANRLATNSLLEGLVFGRAAAQAIEARRLRRPPPRAAARLGREPRVRSGRGRRHRAQLGRVAPPDVELRRHRAHRQAPRARASAASRCCARRSTSTTGTSRSPAICSSCAISSTSRR